MINKKTILFFIFMFIVLYMISPPNNNDNNNDNDINNDVNKLNKDTKKVICNNVDNIENALKDLIVLVKGSCNKNVDSNINQQYSMNNKSSSNKISNEFERELNAKKYLRQKIKESFKDIPLIPETNNTSREEIPPQNMQQHQNMQPQNIQQQTMQLPDIQQDIGTIDNSNTNNYSSYNDIIKDDNILNPFTS